MINSLSMSYQSMSQYQGVFNGSDSNATKNSTIETQGVNIQQLTIEINTQSSCKSCDNFSLQGAIQNIKDSMQDIEEFFGSLDLEGMGYEGKPILELSPSEAGNLLSEGGFFSVENTASRASGFVMSFAGNNVELLREGRAGIIKGFEEAEKLWGGKLPDIAYESHELALKQIDEKINSLGGTTLDILT